MNFVEKTIKTIISQDVNQKPLAEIFEFKYYPKGFTFGPHSHPHVEINFVKRGNCLLQIEDEIVHFDKHDCMIIYPDIPHYFAVENKPSTLVQLEFKMDIFPSLKPAPDMEENLIFLYNLLTNSQRFVKIKNNTEITAVIERIVKELNEQKENYRSLTRLYFAELFIAISRQLNQTLKVGKQHHGKYITTAVKYINLHYNENINVEQVAAQCRISPRYLRKIFHKQLHLSPSEYIINLRLRKACELIKSSSLPFKDIAYATGFTNQQYFTKLFKQKQGITPGKYRAKLFRKV